MKKQRFITTFLIFSVIVSCQDTTSQAVRDYCNNYFSTDVSTCLSIVGGSDAFVENLESIQERWNQDDKSVAVSFYAMYAKDYFEENMTLDRVAGPPFVPSTATPSPSEGDIDSEEPAVKECKWIKQYPDIDRYYPGLDEYIDSGVMQFKAYIISGILDLMYTYFRDSIPTFDERLSVDMLEQILGVDVTVDQLLEYLVDEGVCSKSDYMEEVKAGRSLNPTCYRFKIKSYTHLRDLPVCDVAEKVYKRPVFVEVAVNPYYLQLYSLAASQPIRYAYTRFTVCGVLLGYKWQSEFAYWILSIRRHNVESNRVHIKMSLLNLFGNMGMKMYEVNSDVDDYLKNRFKEVRVSICTINELNNLNLNVTHLTVRDHCLNDVVVAFNLNAYKKLQMVEVQEYSLRQSPSLIMTNLNYLVKVSISRDDFTEMTTAEVPNTVFSKNKRVVLKNLPLLRFFIVGDHSFSDFFQLTLLDLPSIEEISIGTSTEVSADYSNNFYWATELTIASDNDFVKSSLDLGKLRKITLGNYAFSGVDRFKLSELPYLAYLDLGYGAFYGYSASCSVDSAITFENLMMLSAINIHADSMNMFKEIVLRNVPSATNVVFGSGAWDCLNAVRIIGNLESNINIVTAICTARNTLGVFVNEGNVMSCETALQN